MNRIKELRLKKGVTITKLSEDLKIPQSTLTNYENEKRYPKNTETWEIIADYFKVPVAYLMGIEEKNRLKEVLDIKNLTVEQLNKQSNIPVDTLKSYTDNSIEPSPDTLEYLAQLLNISPGYLSGKNDIPKSYNEIRYEHSDPIKIGKLIQLTRKTFFSTPKGFSKMINDRLSLYLKEPENEYITEEDINSWEEGKSLPSYVQLHAISQLSNIEFDKFLSGDIIMRYSAVTIKNILTNMLGEIDKKPLNDLINALNDSTIINFGVADLVQMYTHNQNGTDVIKDKQSLIKYLSQRQDMLYKIAAEENLPDELRIDLGIEADSISEDLNRQQLYDSIFL